MPLNVQSAVLSRRQVGRCHELEYLWNTDRIVSISHRLARQVHSQQLEVGTFPAPAQIEYLASCHSILALVVVFFSDVRCTKAAVAATAVAAVLEKRMATAAMSREGWAKNE